MITAPPLLYRIQRADGKWFAGADSRGHALFRRDREQGVVMIEAWAERQAHVLRCYAHAVELVAEE